ncbi:MAG TPA: methyltransferase [Mycobacteriales bacterium]|nr:methyltransferase [Mycobacteriales bacterium]
MAAPRPYLTHWGRVRTAVVWDALTAALPDLGPAPLSIVDAGGGTGGFAVPLAALGHQVTVVDPSPDSLAGLERRAADEGVPVTAVQGELTDVPGVVGPGGADVVLCHSVLELADDPARGVAAVADALRPGGLASVVAANRTAAVVSRALAGRFEEAAAALDDPAGRWGDGDATRRRFGRDELVALLTAAGLDVAEVHGVRVFTDLVPGGLLDTDAAAFEALVRLELAAAARDPYRDLATQLHVLARSRAG